MTATLNRGGRIAGSVNRGGSVARTMRLLADNGPTEAGELLTLVRGLLGDSAHEKTAHAVLYRLRDLGYVKTKVWLTPEGLAALKKMGSSHQQLSAE